tara:strand:+ start:777 stop:1526 length:750 start_codon:yes stop_codon:yes gene_type:complete
MKKEFYKDIMFWFGFAGLIGVVFSAISIFYTPKKNLQFKVEKLTNLLSIKDSGINLKVFIKDSIEFNEKTKNITIYQIEIKNIGGENIKINDYDENLDFGIELENGEILSNPEIIGSSDLNYFADVIQSNSDNRIIFTKKIFDSESYFIVKFYVLHNKERVPQLITSGKISGQETISLLNNTLSEEEMSRIKDEKISLVFLSLIFTLIGFAGLVYAYLKSIKNQRLIAEQKIIIGNLIEENKQLKDLMK